MHGHRSIVALIGTVLCLAQGPVLLAGEVTYKYREEDGTVWFTDHRPRGANFDDYEFLGYHGRPQATASCKGMTPEKMETRARSVAAPLRRYANRFEVDEHLVRAMMAVESCFDRFAISRVGARGLMQLMPATARSLGVSNAFDPEQNIRGGVEYFSRMLERFSGDITRAVAAYNAGPRAVEHYKGVPPYEETRDYVERVMQRWSDYRDQLDH
ncbi:MAG: lytic transglycosylase domain-containing protein [Halofilum sp. (in: g-proteobacteria)]|nr:lytic transglycosylase domain-containing protein [Halofilum sp. (in: g-proteobacteria)]